MKKSILKSIIGGLLIGVLAFFTGPFALFLLVPFFIFGIFGYRRRWWHGHAGMSPLAFADKVRGMNDEDFANFKNQLQQGFGRSCQYKSAKSTN